MYWVLTALKAPTSWTETTCSKCCQGRKKRAMCLLWHQPAPPRHFVNYTVPTPNGWKGKHLHCLPDQNLRLSPLRQRKPPPIASNFHFKVHVPGMDKWIHRKRPVLLLAQVWSKFMCRNQLFELRSHHDSTNCLERHPYQSDFLPRFWSIRSCFDFLISRGFGGHGLAAGQLTAGSQPLHGCHH